jgi:hypothetical protein
LEHSPEVMAATMGHLVLTPCCFTGSTSPGTPAQRPPTTTRCHPRTRTPWSSTSACQPRHSSSSSTIWRYSRAPGAASGPPAPPPPPSSPLGLEGRGGCPTAATGTASPPYPSPGPLQTKPVSALSSTEMFSCSGQGRGWPLQRLQPIHVSQRHGLGTLLQHSLGRPLSL